jgi:hypothetical protein
MPRIITQIEEASRAVVIEFCKRNRGVSISYLKGVGEEMFYDTIHSF